MLLQLLLEFPQIMIAPLSITIDVDLLAMTSLKDMEGSCDYYPIFLFLALASFAVATLIRMVKKAPWLKKMHSSSLDLQVEQ